MPVWKRSHTLSSAAKGIAVKLAPNFEGRYWITAVLGSNTYRLVGVGGHAEKIMAADQLNPYHGESPESIEVDGEGDSESAPPRETPVSLETGAIPKKERGRPPRLRNEATAPAEPHPAEQEATRTPRRGRGRPGKCPAYLPLFFFIARTK